MLTCYRANACYIALLCNYDKLHYISEQFKKGDDKINYTSKNKEKLIEVLRAVSNHRSIWKARENSQYNASCFNRYLKQIRSLGINSETIPTRWNVEKLGGIFDN